jgi:3-oxoacyl-[acyl-carrier protein] reductase
MASGARELEGRVALVTGASRNIGRATALALAEGGAAVIVNARVSIDEAKAVAREIEARGGKAVALVADVTDEKAVNAMVGEGVARFGRLDILVNNAAVRGVSTSTPSTPPNSGASAASSSTARSSA